MTSGSDVSTDRTFSVVAGYVKGVDRWPDAARDLAMPCRFAFVLDSARRDCVDMFFDVELYRRIVDALWKLSGADAVEFVDFERQISPTTTNDLEDVFRRVMPDASEPLPRLLFMRAGARVLVAESEPWARVGGPAPYHDSYTVAVFSAVDLSRDLSDAAQAIARSTGATLTGVLAADPTPAAAEGKLRTALRSFFR